MTTIILKTITLTNFKGISFVSIDFASRNVIGGSNGTGKTSVFDAFTWLLFGKDHEGRAKFDLKPIDAEGREKHHTDVQVSALLEVNGRELNLERTYKEKWKKPRGAVEAELAGHTEEFRLDGQPLTAAQWSKAIAEICPEDIFRSVTNPRHFAEQKPDEQRKLLFSLVDVSHDDIKEALFLVAGAERAERIHAAFSSSTIEASRAAIAADKKRLKTPLDTLPARIDELKKSLPESTADTARLRADINANETAQRDILNGTAESPEAKERRRLTAEKTARIDQIARRVSEEYNRFSVEQAARVSALDEERAELEVIAAADDLQAYLEGFDDRRETLIEEWRAIKAETFEATDADFRCPCCRRPFEPGQIEEKRAELLERFNADKSVRLADNQARGKALKEEREEVERRLQKAKDARARIIEIDSERLSVKTEKRSRPDLQSAVTAALEADAELSSLRLRLEALPAAADAAAPNEERLAALRTEQQRLTADLAAAENAEKTRARIRDLRAELKDAAQRYADVEKQEEDLNLYATVYAEKVQKEINEKFRLVRFRLFDYLIDGTPRPTCKATVNGVAYASTLNTAARINAGLDIIRTLSEHYGVQAPVFIDNAESVNRLIDIPSQTVELRVTDDADLKVSHL